MSILTIQKRLHERGRIRIGKKVATDKGSRPSKLEHFRFTSPDPGAIERVAALWGGAPQQWESPNGRQWEVFSEADDIPVVVPPTHFGFSQFMELWSGGGCQRRCDTETEMMSGGECLCTLEDRHVCKPTTRLSVILPDIPGLGLWRLETHGWNAAAELAGTLELIANGGRLLPARLRLQQRSAIVDGKTSRFAVPVLDIDVRLGELAGAGVDIATGEIGPAANPNLTPVPVAELGEGPQPSIREQVESVADPVEKPRRANAAQPIPATGLKPRTAAEVAGGGVPADPPSPAPRSDEEPLTAEPVTFDRAPMVERAKRLPTEWQNELNRSRRAEELPALTNGQFTAEQVEAYDRLLTVQEGNWARKLRSDLGRRCREFGLSDDDRHSFVAWVTGGEAAGLTGCTLDQLLNVEEQVALLESDRIEMAYAPEGVAEFSRLEAVS